MVPGDVPGQLRAGLSTGSVQPGGLVSAESGAGSIGAAVPDPRVGARAAPVWVPAHLGVAAARGLGGESQAGAAALPPRRPAGTHAGATAQTHRAAPGAGAGAHRVERAVEHGLCA